MNKSSYKAILQEKQYLKVISANIVSRFGDAVDSIAFGWLVYQLTGSKEWLVVILAVNQIPAIVFQPFAGAMMNKLNKKRLLVFCDICRGMIVLSIGFLYFFQNINPWVLMLLSFLNFTVGSIRIPCALSIVPKILKKENFSFAMSLNQSVSRISELIGLGSSGLLIALLGAGGAVLIDGFSFIGSAAILLLLKVPEDGETTKNSYLRELKEGFSYFRKSQILICITVICFFISLADVSWENLKSAYIQESLRLSVDALSVGSICMSVGLFIGMFLYPYVSKMIKNKKILIFSGLLIGLLYFSLVFSSIAPGVTTKLALYGGTSLLYGISSSAIDLAIGVSMMSNVEPEYMGRAGGIFNALASAATPMGAFILALAAPFLPVVSIYTAAGIIITLLFVGLNLYKPFRRISL